MFCLLRIFITEEPFMILYISQAILDVGEVLQFYDTDKKFPAWGFGARPIDGPVSHCFNLNGSSTYCEVKLSRVIYYNSFVLASNFCSQTAHCINCCLSSV